VINQEMLYNGYVCMYSRLNESPPVLSGTKDTDLADVIIHVLTFQKVTYKFWIQLLHLKLTVLDMYASQFAHIRSEDAHVKNNESPLFVPSPLFKYM
jgi:hypothetical protein